MVLHKLDTHSDVPLKMEEKRELNSFKVPVMLSPFFSCRFCFVFFISFCLCFFLSQQAAGAS